MSFDGEKPWKTGTVEEMVDVKRLHTNPREESPIEADPTIEAQVGWLLSNPAGLNERELAERRAAFVSSVQTRRDMSPAGASAVITLYELALSAERAA